MAPGPDIEGIKVADALWFGRDGVKRDRDAAVALFSKLSPGAIASIGERTATRSRHEGGSTKCAHSCCEHRNSTLEDSRADNARDRPHRNKSICVIGAGPSGLITLRELQHRGFYDISCYEASNDIGGVFAKTYEGAAMTSSNILTAFSCYPITEYEKDCTNSAINDLPSESSHTAVMWTANEYCEYLHAFAKRFQLDQYIHNNIKVCYIQAVGSRWEVHLSQPNNGGRKVATYDAVSICTGLHHSPNIPDWCKNPPPPSSNTKPTMIHSSEFSKGSDVAGKNVVVIGLGESGSDISLLVSKHARSTKISVRGSGSGYVLPRYVGNSEEEVGDLNTSRGFGGQNVWGPAEYRKFAALVNKAKLNDATSDLKELAQCFLGTDTLSPLDLMAIEWNDRFGNLPYNRFGTKNYGFLEAINSFGAELIGEISSWEDIPSNCDMIILCTGFESRFGDFLDEQSHPDVDLRTISSNHRHRYQHMIDLNIGVSLSFIGYSRPAFGAIPPLSEMAARYWALLLTSERSINPLARRELDADREFEERLFNRDAKRIPSLVQYHRSMDNLASLVGCLPPLKELKTNHPGIHARVMHSALSGVQYRLRGDGWAESAWIDILKHPLPVYARQPKNAFRVKADAGLFNSGK